MDGEILVSGDCLFQGYWENEKLSETFENGWFHTKDLGHYCPQKGLTIIGRKDWQFISGGENIQPEEIERALLKCPEIQEVAVIAKPDPEFGFRPAAFIRTNGSSFTFEKMKTALLDQLPKYKIPVTLHILEEFPRKGLKIDREKLRLLL
jgi:O-succinylbenzoic acid--CoA ligase